VVVEDDYDSEFRYDVAPVPALATLSRDRLAYLGTASKTVAPGLRLGWLVPPPHLVDPVCRHRTATRDAASWPVQRTLLALLPRVEALAARAAGFEVNLLADYCHTAELTGLVVGWRIRGSFLDALVGYGVLLVFAYAVSWIMAWIGMLVPSPEVVNNASFVVIFPLTFVANTFVPLSTLPSGLQTFAEWNPVSAVTQAARELFGNVQAGAPEPTAWPLVHPVAYTMLWSLVILLVFVPLANAQYRRSTSR